MARRRIKQEERDIPTDIIAEILSWLPAISLLKLKLVCKSWLQLISSPEFAQMHLNKSNEGLNGTRVLISSPWGLTNHKDAFGLHSIGNKLLIYLDPLADQNIQILGSWDGLLCFFNKCIREVSLWNPSTTKSVKAVLKSDEPRYTIRCSWFGRHPVDREYAFLIGKENLCLKGNIYAKIEVYNISSKSSNLYPLYSCSIPDQCYFACFEFFEETGTLLHKNLHWPAKRRSTAPNYCTEKTYIVFAYNIQKNEVIKIPAPPAECQHFTLGVVDGCLLAIVRKCSPKVFELWIMKEYGVQKSWTKHGNIDGYIYPHLATITPLGFCQNGDQITTVDGVITKYSFGHDQKKLPRFLMLHGSYFSKAIACPDSLVAPELINSGK